MLYFVTSFLRQFFENCKDGNDMGRLEVFIRLEIFSSLSLYTFAKQAADLLKNV